MTDNPPVGVDDVASWVLHSEDFVSARFVDLVDESGDHEADRWGRSSPDADRLAGEDIDDGILPNGVRHVGVPDFEGEVRIPAQSETVLDRIGHFRVCSEEGNRIDAQAL